MSNKFLLLLIVAVCLPAVNGLIIEGVETDKDSYQNGDLVTIDLYANMKGLAITADFIKVDSNYKSGMVDVEESEDFVYHIYYPITFSNINGDGNYPVTLMIYDKTTDKTSVAQAIVTLGNNAENRTTENVSITLRVRKSSTSTTPITNVSVRNGTIRVCNSTSCQTLSQEEYERARNIIISSGRVTLSNLTYEQLKLEILTDIEQKNQEQIQLYINRIIKIDNDLQNSMLDVQNLIKKNQEATLNQSNITQHMVKKVEYEAFGIGTACILFIASIAYIIWLKANTTHLD
jgi:hypothetical protein